MPPNGASAIPDKRLVRKLETHNMETVAELFALADKCAWEAKAQIRIKHQDAPAEKASSFQKAGPDDRRSKQKVVTAAVTDTRPQPRANHRTNRNAGTPAPNPKRSTRGVRSTRPTSMTSPPV